MPRKQTRRSVTLSATDYDRVKTYCDDRGQSMSSFIEERTAEFFVGVQRHADDDEAPVESPEPEPVPERPFEMSGLERTTLKPYKKPPIRGGGVHEF